ncbi:MAG: gamma-glutamyltransferase [Thermoleophilaceae bacterium]|nr:gamma-glutamyltransferase [Thermoleophilaceae bacterium]
MGRRVATLALAALAALAPAAGAQAGATATGHGGAAASVDRAATRTAISVLRRGGNAVDAAVAAAGVLGVVEPYSCGIGGGGFMVIRTPSGRVTTIDSRELSPAAMTPTSFMENGEPLEFDPARYSGLSAGVPGTVRGWSEALEGYGTWSLGRALHPGAAVARRGFRVDDTFVSQTEDNVPWFDDVPSTAALYLDPDGTPRDAGTIIRNRDLARTYGLIARRGPRAFYEGPIADAIVKASNEPPVAAGADHVWRPGLLSAGDLESYTAPERRPTRVRFRGLDVWGMGPPSSGGSTVGEVLNILDGYRALASDRTRALHLLIESERLAFADRGAYLADPDFFDVPLRDLLSRRFAAERRELIDPAAAGTSPAEPGDPYGDGGGPGHSTTHLTVSDGRGTVVSYTFTIESIGGNGIVVPGHGFLLNNELTDFDYDDPAAPNSSDGRKRPRSSMSPTIVTRRGRPYLAVGSPGGATIITTVAQILLDRLALGASLPDAIAAPRVSQRNATPSQAEQAFVDSPEGRALAAGYGQTFETPDDPEIGAATGIDFGRHGRVLAAAEPVRRGSGSAAVERP